MHSKARCSSPWIAGLTLMACTTAATDDPVLATYRGGEITASEYPGLAGRQAAVDPQESLADAALVEWLAAEARANGLEARRDLALQLQRLEDRPAVKALEQRIRAENEPTGEAIRQYLDGHRHQLEKPRKIRLSNLFKRAPQDGPKSDREAARRTMEVLRARVLAGEDFAELAKRESDGVNRYRGGKMGAIPPGQLRKGIEDVAFALAEGEISPVIAIPDGFVILKNGGFVEASTMTEEEAIGRIRDAMRRWNFEDAWEALRRALLDSGAELLDPRQIDASAPDTVIGTVAGEPLTYGDVDAIARSQSGGSGPTNERLTPFRLHAVLEQHAFHRLAAIRATELGVETDPQSVLRAAAARARLLAAAELDRRARERQIEVSEFEARAFFDANPRLFSLPDRHQVSVIQFRLDDADPRQLREKTGLGRRTVERIKVGATTFAAAAREVSEHPSAEDGGDLGMKPRRWAAALGPNVLAAFDELEPGQTTDLIRQDHLWILRLGDVESGRPLSWEEAREAAHWGVERQKVRAHREEIEAALREELLSSLVILELPEAVEDPRARSRPQRPPAEPPVAGVVGVERPVGQPASAERSIPVASSRNCFRFSLEISKPAAASDSSTSAS